MRSNLNLTECTVGCGIIHLSVLSWRRGRPGIGRRFELKAFFASNAQTQGHHNWSKEN